MKRCRSNGSRDMAVFVKTGPTASLLLRAEKMIPDKRVKTDHIVLREWLFQHPYNAYPTRDETQVLANETQLTKKQVSYWFINARRRILPAIFRREGRDPQKFVRGRSWSSLFSSTSVSGHISSTSSSSSLSLSSSCKTVGRDEFSCRFKPRSVLLPPKLLSSVHFAKRCDKPHNVIIDS